jgi:hypothetical protein
MERKGVRMSGMQRQFARKLLGVDVLHRKMLSLLENYGDHHEWCSGAPCTCGFEQEMKTATAEIWGPSAALKPFGEER